MDAVQEEQQGREIPFRFTGNTREYFGIWIVNICLMLVTLGIYAPWAKVRKKRYFYGNTILDGSNFDYVANPVAILKGRAIAVVLFMGYSFVSDIYPIVATIVLAIAVITVVPWIVIRSLAFRARNTLWRNIRFDFSAKYGEAIKYIGAPALLVPFTLGLAYPYMVYLQKRFVVGNSAYGTSKFEFKGTTGGYYGLYLGAAKIGLAVVVVQGIVAALLLSADALSIEAASTLKPLLAMTMGFFVFFAVAAGIFVYAYLNTAIINYTLNHTSINEGQLKSTLKTGQMIKLYMGNAIAILFSLGLLVPWASIRIAQYKIENLAFLTPEGLDTVMVGPEAQVSAAGEEVGEMFDLDIGI